MQVRLKEATVVGGILAAFGFIALGFALAIEPDAQGNANARIFPVIGAAAIAVLGLLEWRRGWIADPRPLALSENLSAILALLLLAVSYAWLLAKLGYLIATGLAAPVAMWLFGIRSPLGLLLSALICPTVYHLLFFELMGVFPPYGEWFDLLDFIQGGY